MRIYLRGNLPKKVFSNLKKIFRKSIREYSKIIQKIIFNLVEYLKKRILQISKYKYLIRCDFCCLIHDGYCDQLFLLKDKFFIVLSTILTKSFSKDTALLILRVITGTVLIHHGYEKLANIENFADAFVRPLHLPFPIFLSYIAAFSEIGMIRML